MNKLFRRSSFVLSMIAAFALLIGAPAGASAAGEEYSSGSASGGAVVEPSGDSAQPGTPDSTEWTPGGSGGGASSDGAAPLQRGSSVGSGVVPEKAEPKSEAPAYSPEPGGSYEPEPPASSQTSSPSPSPGAFEEPASTPPADSGSQSEEPPAAATAPKANRAVDVEVGAADAVARAAPPQGGNADPAPKEAAAPVAGADAASASSYTLPLLLALLVLAVILGYAYVRLRRHRQRQRLEALWREQDAVWEAALRRAELGQVAGDSEPSAQPVPRISVG